MIRFLVPISGILLLGSASLPAQDDEPARIVVNGREDESLRINVVIGARRLIDRTIVERRAAAEPDPGDALEVILSAYSNAKIPLLKLIEEDRRLAPTAYRRRPRLPPRSLESLVVFLERKGHRCGAETPYEAGDVLVWKQPDGRLHAAILSKAGSAWSGPEIVHRPGARVVEEPLPDIQRVGHFRWWKKRLAG